MCPHGGSTTPLDLSLCAAMLTPQPRVSWLRWATRPGLTSGCLFAGRSRLRLTAPHMTTASLLPRTFRNAAAHLGGRRGCATVAGQPVLSASTARDARLPNLAYTHGRLEHNDEAVPGSSRVPPIVQQAATKSCSNGQSRHSFTGACIRSSCSKLVPDKGVGVGVEVPADHSNPKTVQSGGVCSSRRLSHVFQGFAYSSAWRRSD